MNEKKNEKENVEINNTKKCSSVPMTSSHGQDNKKRVTYYQMLETLTFEDICNRLIPHPIQAKEVSEIANSALQRKYGMQDGVLKAILIYAILQCKKRHNNPNKNYLYLVYQSFDGKRDLYGKRRKIKTTVQAVKFLIDYAEKPYIIEEFAEVDPNQFDPATYSSRFNQEKRNIINNKSF